MCAECHSWPHAPGCPNAPEPEAAYICGVCGEPVYEEVYYDLYGIKECPDCNDKRRRVV